jgi:signal transduction histidine kinase
MYTWIILFKTGEIYSAIILISVIFIVLSSGFVLFIIRFKMKQGLHFLEKKKMSEEFSMQLMQSQIEVQETTMSMLGQELHDNICQQISSTKLIAAYAIRRPEEAQKMLVEIEGHLGKTIDDIRLLTKSMDKEWLEKFNLIANLVTEVNRINASQMLNIRLRTLSRLFLETDKQLMLFRIIQEALQNAIRHAGASQIEIIINTDNVNINTLITDNGRGFTVDDRTTGLGMRNMKHRTDLLKGNITWTSAGKGSIVHISIPISQHANEN